MQNDTNPLVGISRTAVPAAEAALVVRGIQTLPKLYGLIKTAKSTPHGVQNLVTNTVAQVGIGGVGSVVGERVDKELGGEGNTGRMLFGLGSIYGFNKTPFMRDFNQALARSTASKSDMDNYVTSRGGNKYEYVETSPGDGTLYEHGDDVVVAISPNEGA